MRIDERTFLDGLRCFHKEAVVRKWKKSQIITFEIFHITLFLLFACGIIEYLVIGDNRQWAEIRFMGIIAGTLLCLGIAISGLVSYLRQKKETKEDA